MTTENDPELPLETKEEGDGSAGARAEAEGRSIGDEIELQEATRTELQQLKEAARFVTPERALQVLEALFFAAEKPLDMQMLAEATQFDKEILQKTLADLQSAYAPGTRGVHLVDLGGRWQLRTDPSIGAYVRRMLQVKPLRLTRAALETLAIVAYRQPVTRPEIEDLRGVDCGAVTKALLERKLIRILGKKDEPGRPLLYGTSKEFLDLFNLRDLTQLPTLREFQELSEESRKIVEEEAPAPSVAGLAALAQETPEAAQAVLESESALAQLESAMDQADETAKTAAAVLTPPPETKDA
ncbi:MAG: SMC-Scp complex subunit ScpB [Myxococcales bacterium]|nr:SMC-Scp complex subunit ScpB [Myxococcales bacterium]